MPILEELGLGRRTLVMGVLNITPDSFSDGGKFDTIDKAVAGALAMVSDGADIIDIGGESTRPATFRDQAPLSADDEIQRVVPVISALRRHAPDLCISIDTYKSSVAQAAMEAGANMLNDVSGLSAELDPPKMALLAAEYGVPLVLMHMPGTPHAMPEIPLDGDLIGDIKRYLAERIALAISVGVGQGQIIVDPGIGFGKNDQQNAEIIRRLSEFRDLGYPILSGPSRKRFLGRLLNNAEADDRLEGSAAAVALSIAGGADILRIHDVRFIARLARVCDGILKPSIAGA